MAIPVKESDNGSIADDIYSDAAAFLDEFFDKM